MTDPLATSAQDENPYKSPLANVQPQRTPARRSPLRKAHWVWVAFMTATYLGGGVFLILGGVWLIVHSQNALDANRDFASQSFIETFQHGIFLGKSVCCLGGVMALIGAVTPVVAWFKPEWVIKLSRIKQHHTS